MEKVDTFDRWLIGDQPGTDRVRILAPPSPHDLLTADEAMVMAAHLLCAAGCDRERFRVILDAVLEDSLGGP